GDESLLRRVPGRGAVPVARRPRAVGDRHPAGAGRGTRGGPDPAARPGPVDGVQAPGVPARLPAGGVADRGPPVLLLPGPPGAGRPAAQRGAPARRHRRRRRAVPRVRRAGGGVV
ncbi:MAG: Transcriptional regulator, ArsR family, partial [uncultured Pseudonocardia sp.]